MRKYIYCLFLIIIGTGLESCDSNLESSIKNEEKTHQSSIRLLDTLPIVFKMNTKVSFEFGLPIPSNADEIYYCLTRSDTIIDDVNGGDLSLVINGDVLSFDYNKDSTYIRGAFLIPEFQEVRYQKEINPETFIANKIYPLSVYNPIRYHQWMFFDGNKIDTINYSILLDKSKMEDFCF